MDLRFHNACRGALAGARALALFALAILIAPAPRCTRPRWQVLLSIIVLAGALLLTAFAVPSALADGGAGGNGCGNTVAGGAGGTGFSGNSGGAGVGGSSCGNGGGGGGAAGGGTGGVGGSQGAIDGGAGGAGGSNGISTATLNNSAPLAGGSGAGGGDASGPPPKQSGGGGGGAGGYGAIVSGSGASSNSSTIAGGNGGNGGNGQSRGGTGGSGGDGGVGVQFTATGATFTNLGTVTGGNGGSGGSGGDGSGSNGAGGVGIVGSGLAIINGGTITGGLSGDGVTRANAITFTGGVNSLTLQPGSSIAGNVVAFSAADTLALGGSGSASFDVSQIGSNAQYQGFGVFQKTGTSTWTLTGTTTAVTPWAINGGTLAVSADNNLGDASGGLSFNGGTLQYLSGFSSSRSVTLNAGGGTFDTNGNNATLAGTISGIGALTKIGTGTMILTGSNTYTGGTTISAGALIVSGSIASSSLTTVNSGAALIGSGAVGSTVINAGGFLAPGPVGTPGNMTVAGNLALRSGSFYIVQVNPTTASTTNVSGTASLAGTVAAIFALGTYIPRSYTILTADGGLMGSRFDALATFGLPPNFGRNVSYTGNTALLNLTARLVPEPPPTTTPSTTTPTLASTPPIPAIPGLPPAVGLLPPAAGPPTTPGLPPTPEDPPDPPTLPFTVNQLNVGHAIDNFFNNGGALPPAFLSLFGLTGSNLTTALSQLSGEAATGAQKVAFQLTDQFLGLMLDPFVDGRCGIGRTDQPPLGFAGDCEARPSALGFAPERATMPPAISLAYASVLKEPRAPLAPVYEPRWTAWGGAYGGSNHTSGDIAITGSHDLSANTAGFAGGFDYHYSPDTVLGFAFAGGGTNWSLSQGLGGGRSDAFQAGVYGATKSGPAYLAAAFAFANHWMSTDRLAVFDHLSADFNAQSYSGRLEGGYRFGMAYGGITPYAAIQARDFHTPSYSETDAIPNGFALAFGSRDATDTRSELGTRFDRVVAAYSNAVLALRGRVAWAHDWISDATLMPVFQALPGASFIVNGATLAKNSALTSAGAEQGAHSVRWSRAGYGPGACQ
jgi:uncharacterized protein with beta-barrel porin domain